MSDEGLSEIYQIKTLFFCQFNWFFCQTIKLESDDSSKFWTLHTFFLHFINIIRSEQRSRKYSGKRWTLLNIQNKQKKKDFTTDDAWCDAEHCFAQDWRSRTFKKAEKCFENTVNPQLRNCACDKLSRIIAELRYKLKISFCWT